MTADQKPHHLQASLTAPRHEVFEYRARVLGEIWIVKSLCGRAGDMGFESLSQIYDPALRHNQVRVFFNSLGEPIGYVVWAWLAPDVEQRWMAQGQLSLHISEWTEGDALWLLDGMIAPGYAPDAVRSALGQLFPHAPFARVVRRRNGMLIFKELAREVWGRFGDCPILRQ